MTLMDAISNFFNPMETVTEIILSIGSRYLVLHTIMEIEEMTANSMGYITLEVYDPNTEADRFVTCKKTSIDSMEEYTV